MVIKKNPKIPQKPQEAPRKTPRNPKPHDLNSSMTSTQIKLKRPKEKLNRKQITKGLKSQIYFTKHTYENLLILMSCVSKVWSCLKGSDFEAVGTFLRNSRTSTWSFGSFNLKTSPVFFCFSFTFALSVLGWYLTNFWSPVLDQQNPHWVWVEGMLCDSTYGCGELRAVILP